MKGIVPLPLVLVCALGFAGCSTTSNIGHGRKDGVAPLAVLPSRIVVAAPKLTFENVSKETAIEGDKYRAAELGERIVGICHACLREKGVARVEAVGSQGGAQIAASAEHAFSGSPDAQFIGLVRKMGGGQGAVLVQYVRVKIGPGAFWDPNSGAIASRSSSSQFRAALFDAQTGQVLWKDAVEMRDVPSPHGGTLDKTVRELLSTLTAH